MKDVVIWLIIEVYFIQLQDWGGELLKAIGEPEKAGEVRDSQELWRFPTAWNNLCKSPADKKGLREGRSREGNKDLQLQPQETQPEQGDLPGLPVRVKLAHTKGWLSQLGQDPGEGHVRNGARCPPNNGSGDAHLMITSDSLSTGFSTGLQQEETSNQGALHYGSAPTIEAQAESLAL